MISIHKAALLFIIYRNREVWGNATFGGTLRLFYKVNTDEETDEEFDHETFAVTVIEKYKLPNCSFSEQGRQDDGIIDLDIDITEDLTVMSKLIESLKVFPETVITSNEYTYWKIR